MPPFHWLLTLSAAPGAGTGASDGNVAEIALFVLLGVALGAAGGALAHRFFTSQTIRSARDEAERIVAAGRQEAETEREKLSLEAERRAIQRREQVEAELDRIRDELKDNERRLVKREDNLDRKLDTLASKERHLDERAERVAERETASEQRERDTTDVLERQKAKLLEIADLTPERARSEVLERVEAECRSEIDALAQKHYLEAESEAKSRAREVVLNSIQRYAAEYVAESTVRAVPIPSDDMKGRIIGREGRNIRAIALSTGVDVMVDDTPGLISVSCFDKVRQTIAAEALERLIADGRIHPTRIEEVVERVRKEVEERIVQYGKKAATEVKLRGLHPRIVEAMGKLHFRTSYGQNVLQHSIEVAYLSQIIADQLGLDGVLARRCGYLHDIGKAMDQDMEGGHPAIGMEFCRKFKEPEKVLNAIGGHHGDIPATSVYTPIVMAADAVSGARPGARRESMEQYVKRLEELEGIARDQEGVTEAYAIQAGREVRIVVDADRVNDADAFGIARRVANRVSEEMTFPGEIRVTVLRETRAVEYAT